MGTNILNIGQTALQAAQMGITTTGHNIANASTPGYSRQVLVQTANPPQNLGGAFVGQGVSISLIQRQYNQFIGQQVNAAQTSTGQVEAYYTQIKQINNLVADSSAGVTPALQDFFKAVQNLSSSPNGTAGAAARQSVLSTGQALSSRLNDLQGRMDMIRNDINGEINTAVTSINAYATELAALNDTIAKSQSTTGSPPNDLLDQRDQIVTELSKLTKVTVIPQDNKYNVFIGNGQPIVLGGAVNQLQVSVSPTDPTRTEIAYTSNGKLTQIPENGLPGGKLGGLFDFRANTLDPAQSSIGRIAIGVATAFNDQHTLGQDLNGQAGTQFFKIDPPVVKPSSSNTSQALLTASVTDASQLTTSDYRLQVTAAGQYRVTRMSDGVITNATSQPVTVDGVRFEFPQPPQPQPAVGDEFQIKPTAYAAAGIAVQIIDPNKVAAAAPITTSIPSTNTGTGKISNGVQDSPVATNTTSATATIGAVKTDDTFKGSAVASPVTLTYSGGNLTGFPAGQVVTVTSGGTQTNYNPPATVPYTSGATISVAGMSFSISNGTGAPANGDTFTLGSAIPATASKLTFASATNTLSGFPAGANVTVKNGNTSTIYTAGTPVPYTPGATYSFNGSSVTLTGAPANGDVFNIGPNTSGGGDNRNALELAKIQTANFMNGNSTTIQGSYAQFVSQIGNKTSELAVTKDSENKMLQQAVTAQQSESGVNLDEEAANLLRYQQAYQAAGKLMQIASTLFDALLNIGR